MRLSPGDQQQPPPPSLDWRGVIQCASTEQEIVNITREYLASWSPDEIARLPAACRPGRIRDGEDITQWAFELAITHCASSPGGDEHLLVKMLVFVTQASLRLSQLNATDRDADAA